MYVCVSLQAGEVFIFERGWETERREEAMATQAAADLYKRHQQQHTRTHASLSAYACLSPPPTPTPHPSALFPAPPSPLLHASDATAKAGVKECPDVVREKGKNRGCVRRCCLPTSAEHVRPSQRGREEGGKRRGDGGTHGVHCPLPPSPSLTLSHLTTPVRGWSVGNCCLRFECVSHLTPFVFLCLCALLP